MSYLDKLRDPRWQRRKTEALTRDNFTCQVCGNDKLELQVHHIYYKRETEPWDYPLSALQTLCSDCHKMTHDIGNNAMLEYQLIKENFSKIGINQLELALFGRIGMNNPETDLMHRNAKRVIEKILKHFNNG